MLFFLYGAACTCDLLRPLWPIYGKYLSCFTSVGTQICTEGLFCRLRRVHSCLLLSQGRWERAHSSVMRLTCGPVTEVMMSSLDGEVSAADSFRHRSLWQWQGTSGEIPPESTGPGLMVTRSGPFLVSLASGDGWKLRRMQSVFLRRRIVKVK